MTVQPDLERAQQYVLRRLEHELYPKLTYHSIRHTRDDVVPAVERFAAMEGITGDDLLALRTAAWFHDLGYIEQHVGDEQFGDGHEACGARIAAAVLPDFGYTVAHIDLIQRLIMATQWPTNPQTLLEQIMADADLDSLGRDDFLITSQNLRDEQVALFGNRTSDVEWYTSQRAFLKAHHYYTNAARSLRGAGKYRNMLLIERLLSEASQDGQ
ncbi:MAG: HD domain-containing protein [Anaerolineae bacterium]|nr:HD domain-containing protein [Anaerolineae bacterium]